MKPILFSTPMVQAILKGRKSQTRRIMKNPFRQWMSSEATPEWLNGLKTQCPHGQVGDILWVRETWQYVDDSEYNGYVYKASNPYRETFTKGWTWKPSIFMPKEAARIFLKITNIRAERLQDIIEKDAIAEGVQNQFDTYRNYLDKEEIGSYTLSAKESFETLWQSINGEKSWNENPYVWVIEFEKTEKP